MILYFIIEDLVCLYFTEKLSQTRKIVAKLSNPNQDRVDMAKSLLGIIPADITLDEAREERLSQICELS